eukprot:6173692-Pleurochrysis_carterae.AAC.5
MQKCMSLTDHSDSLMTCVKEKCASQYVFSQTDNVYPKYVGIASGGIASGLSGKKLMDTQST